MGSPKFRQMIDTSEEDRKFLQKFEEELKLLTGMIEEIFNKEKQLLLSPVFREMMILKGRDVAGMFAAMQGRLCCDNPGEPLKKVPHGNA